MGIRGLLSVLTEGLGGKVRVIPLKGKGFVVARLYIDVPQFVYKAIKAIEADALMQNREADLSDDNIIAKTIEIILELIRDISPRLFLGIYFDGIPPMAKVVEQRARRYGMMLEPSGFNKAKITVGTAFLRSLVDRLAATFKQIADSQLPPEIEISTPAEPGEGEHKLMSRIRETDASLPGVKVIVADDSDVMVMCLLNSVRETYVFIDHAPPRPIKGFVSIGTVADRVATRLGNTPTAIYDFCFMVIFSGGNDFLPYIQAARDRREIISVLLDMYNEPPLNGQPFMVNAGREISWQAVRTLVSELSKIEERLLVRLVEFTKKRLGGRVDPLYTRSMDPRTGQFKLSLFRKAWDEMLYQPRAAQDVLPEGIVIGAPTAREIEADHAYSAREYLKGVAWTLGYMRTGDGPDWYYDSAFPPLYGDLARLFSILPDPVKSLRAMPPWNPQMLAVYLLTVLPRATTRELFGDSFSNAFTRGAGIADLLPLSFDKFGPAQILENTERAILPPLDLQRLKKVVDERLDSWIIESNLRELSPRLYYNRRRAGGASEWKTLTAVSREQSFTKERADHSSTDTPRSDREGIRKSSSSCSQRESADDSVASDGSPIRRPQGGKEYDVLDLVIPSLSAIA